MRRVSGLTGLMGAIFIPERSFDDEDMMRQNGTGHGGNWAFAGSRHRTWTPADSVTLAMRMHCSIMDHRKKGRVAIWVSSSTGIEKSTNSLTVESTVAYFRLAELESCHTKQRL